MKKKYKAVIIGAGNIGAFYSLPNKYDGILTHAHAYQKEKRTKLIAFLDVDFNQAKQAAKIWGVKAYHDMNEMFQREKIDIVSICTPDETHQTILKRCLKYAPKAVFCEKPLTTDLQEAKFLVKAYAKAKIVLAVNYSRRWDKNIINLKQEIKINQYGESLNIVGSYTKGILHNGSHLIDLLRFFFGEISEAISLAGRIDWKRNDPTLDGFLKFKKGNMAHIITADERYYSIFDLDLFFKKGRIYLSDFGNRITYFQVRNNKLIKEGQKLYPIRIKKVALNKAILDAISNLIDAVDKKGKLLSSGANALKTQTVCQKLLDLYHQRGSK